VGWAEDFPGELDEGGAVLGEGLAAGFGGAVDPADAAVDDPLLGGEQAVGLEPVQGGGPSCTRWVHDRGLTPIPESWLPGIANSHRGRHVQGSTERNGPTSRLRYSSIVANG
jgi:hypothetical protein